MGRRNGTERHRRAISPVVGGALMIAILVALAVFVGGLLLGLGQEQPPAPEVSLDLQPVEGSGDYELVHQSGAEIDGDRLRIRGVENPDALAGRTFGAGDRVRLTPTADEIRIVWERGRGERGTSYLLQTFAVDPVEFTGVLAGAGTLQARISGQVQAIEGDGGALEPFAATGTVKALGPATEDLDEDGVLEVPYIGSGGDLKTVDSDGDTGTLATDADVSGGSLDTDKTRLAVGSWGGSDPSVFFSDGSDDIYRVAPGGSPTSVASPSNGVNAVVGTGDIDGDGTDELVFADGSQTIRYVEPGDPDSGSFTAATTGVTAGSSTGIGAGGLFDADGDGAERVAVVDGGNDVVLVDSSGGDEIDNGDVAGGSAPDAKQSPPTVADVDGDGAPELVYLGNDDGKLKYLDGLDSHVRSGSDMEVEFLRDDTGSKIDGATRTGVTS